MEELYFIKEQGLYHGEDEGGSMTYTHEPVWAKVYTKEEAERFCSKSGTGRAIRVSEVIDRERTQEAIKRLTRIVNTRFINIVFEPYEDSVIASNGNIGAWLDVGSKMWKPFAFFDCGDLDITDVLFENHMDAVYYAADFYT